VAAETIALKDHALMPLYFTARSQSGMALCQGRHENSWTNFRSRWISIDQAARIKQFPCDGWRWRLLLATFRRMAFCAGTHAESVLNRGNGAEPDRSIPLAGSAAEANILGDMMVGLTTLDAARPVFRHSGTLGDIARRPDLTFHLRKARWSDGTPVTAQNFVCPGAACWTPRQHPARRRRFG
jgi:hypothetical protein